MVAANEVRNVYLFSALSAEQLDEFLHSARVVLLQEKEQLFSRGQPAISFFLVRRGHVKLSRVSPDGNEKIVDILGPGQTFAEAVMFMAGKEYPVNAEALTAAEVISFNSASFQSLLRNSVDTCFRVMGDMSQRLHRRLTEIDNLTLHDATFRLVTYLLSQRSEGAQPEIHLAVPKSVIASRLSIQPETFSRILARLGKQELIAVKGNTITLLNLQALREMTLV